LFLQTAKHFYFVCHQVSPPLLRPFFKRKLSRLCLEFILFQFVFFTRAAKTFSLLQTILVLLFGGKQKKGKRVREETFFETTRLFFASLRVNFQLTDIQTTIYFYWRFASIFLNLFWTFFFLKIRTRDSSCQRKQSGEIATETREKKKGLFTFFSFLRKLGTFKTKVFVFLLFTNLNKPRKKKRKKTSFSVQDCRKKKQKKCKLLFSVGKRDTTFMCYVYCYRKN